MRKPYVALSEKNCVQLLKISGIPIQQRECSIRYQVSSIQHPSTRNLQLATRNTQLATRNPKHATRNPKHATRNTQPATRNTQPATHTSSPLFSAIQLLHFCPIRRTVFELWQLGYKFDILGFFKAGDAGADKCNQFPGFKCFAGF